MFTDYIINKAIEGEKFSANMNANETMKIWKQQRDEISNLADQIHSRWYKRILFSASGASYPMLFLENIY
jgi:hypothetical protein